ncbi:pitrilysin family protein [Altererythrobacter sp. ZODW24]|uniref:M16 family metallopeptidase n=1 Tax=Altererythrobacter sp. ZODW24 TaxID=2185142 RepID=UPI000DF7EF52|nr:pitrilysin family protein [Altererythrobacter sp. ZODW24]
MLKTVLAAGAAAIALAAAAPLAAQESAGETAITAPEIEFTEWMLDNGLRVIAIEDDTTSTVTTSLWYEIGSKLDPEGRSGFAHLFEHIGSRKTENMPYNMIYGLTADIGGTRNASNSPDRTNYFETVPAQYLERMLWTHKERMALTVVDDDVFETERGVVKEELRQRVLAPPYGRFSRFVLPENSYDVLPQRRPGIGSIEELDSATLDDARAFYQAYYGPDTATLIVAGNFDMANLRTLVDEYFADIPRRPNPIPLAIETREPERTEPRFVTATAPNVPLPLVGATWKVPPAGHPDMAALEMMDIVMSQGENSRIHEALIRSGKAVQAQQFLNGSEEGGFFAQFAVINPAADPDEVNAIMTAVREDMRTNLVSDAELSEARNELFALSLRRRETARGRAFELGEALVLTGDPKAADKRLTALAAVTAEDIRRVAQKYLKPEARVEFTYTQGEDDKSAYANPAPFPTFRSLPAATGEPRKVNPPETREAPPGPTAKPVVAMSEIVETTLANGIQVVATQTGDVPIATMTVLLPGGSASDPRSKAGIAEFAAGLANKGTANMSATEIAARLESLGASMSGTAGTDGTFFSLTAPVATMEAAGEVLADVIRSATYPDDEFERERKRAIDGLQVSLKEPGALARYVMQPALYGGAAYGTLADGTPESLAALTAADLVNHRETYWHPSRTKVIVSGGISADDATALANRLLGGWTVDSAPPPVIADPDGKAQPVRTIVVDMPEAGQAAVIAAVRSVSRSDEQYYPLMLANSVLGGGSSGRLFEEVRTKRSLSYGAYSGMPSRAGEAVLSASAQTKNESAADVAKIFLDEFARLGTEPLEEEALEKRRLFLGGAYARSLETSSGFNGIVAGLLQQGIEPAEAAKLAERLSAVSAEDASAAAKATVDPEQATLIIVGDSKQFIDGIRELRPDVEVIPAAELNLSNETLRSAAE